MVAQSTLPAVRAETLEEVDAVDARAPVSAGAADAVVDICIKKKFKKKRDFVRTWRNSLGANTSTYSLAGSYSVKIKVDMKIKNANLISNVKRYELYNIS